MKRSGSAVWSGDLKSGHGTVSTPSGALSETPYSFHTRFEEGAGTNPEELVAAAHAGCFAMALSARLGEDGVAPERIEAKATVTLEKTDQGWRVTHSHLDVTVKLPGGTEGVFAKAAEDAKANCPISRLLTAGITMDARLA
ncbi:MAG: OsmC family protein [Bryobacterales bacterium]|nr:OsmC family protein [Bryobacterales bacterium]